MNQQDLQRLMPRVNGVSFNPEKIQQLAAAIISYDELIGLVKNSKNLGFLQQYELEMHLTDAMRKAFRGY